MNNFSKLSLYDFLAMLIPGFVILWFFNFFGINTDNSANCFLLGVLSYIVGLCYHKVVEWLCRIAHIRRNECIQKKAWDDFYQEIKEKTKKESNEIPEAPPKIDTYYVAAYYQIAKAGCLMNIPVLEVQETFLRNAFLLILGTICKITCCSITSCPCCLVVLLVILFVFSIVSWCCIQKKIYYLVWEGNYYLTHGEEILSNYKAKTRDEETNS